MKQTIAHPLFKASIALAFVVTSLNLSAQIGSGWIPETFKSPQKIHLQEGKNLKTYKWADTATLGTPPLASYAYDKATLTHTFTNHTLPGGRSEIRLMNEYRTGSRQFEAYVTFNENVNGESLFQLWGSTDGATLMQIRGQKLNGGCISVNWIGGQPRLLNNLYNKEFKLNVIHLQNDVGNKVLVYVNNEKIYEFPDNEDVDVYMKYGVYGDLKDRNNASTKFRDVKVWRDGVAPGQ
jgi:hypothetical protein